MRHLRDVAGDASDGGERSQLCDGVGEQVGSPPVHDDGPAAAGQLEGELTTEPDRGAGDDGNPGGWCV
jgi:hypothetical protein